MFPQVGWPARPVPPFVPGALPLPISRHGAVCVRRSVPPGRPSRMHARSLVFSPYTSDHILKESQDYSPPCQKYLRGFPMLGTGIFNPGGLVRKRSRTTNLTAPHQRLPSSLSVPAGGPQGPAGHAPVGPVVRQRVAARGRPPPPLPIGAVPPSLRPRDKPGTEGTGDSVAVRSRKLPV